VTVKLDIKSISIQWTLWPLQIYVSSWYKLTL